MVGIIYDVYKYTGQKFYLATYIFYQVSSKPKAILRFCLHLQKPYPIAYLTSNHEFAPRPGHIILIEIGHVYSTTSLSLPLIQVWQVMCTKFW